MEKNGDSSRIIGADASRFYKEKPRKTFTLDRVCSIETCETKLSRYNKNDYCWSHADKSLASSALGVLRVRDEV